MSDHDPYSDLVPDVGSSLTFTSFALPTSTRYQAVICAKSRNAQNPIVASKTCATVLEWSKNWNALKRRDIGFRNPTLRSRFHRSVPDRIQRHSRLDTRIRRRVSENAVAPPAGLHHWKS